MASSRSELRSNWRIVLVCGVGISAGISGIPFYTLGLFVAPLESAFGWSRAEVQTMFLVFTCSGVFAVPLVAWTTDRWGVRSVVLFALAGSAIGYVCLSQLTQSLTTFYIGAALLAILGAGTSPVTWTKALSGWFDRQRGLALGLALAGTGAAAIVAPAYVAKVLDVADWRMAYLALAAFPLLAIPLVFLLLKDPPGSGRSTEAASQTSATGVSLGGAVRNWKLWVIALAFFLLSAAIAGAISNLVPLMMDVGLPRSRAAEFAGIIGIAVIAGRMGTGYLIDKLWAPAVGAVVQGVPVISALILAQADPSLPMLVVAIVILGFAAGAEFDLIAFLVSRYFGLRNYAKIYAVPYTAFIMGAGMAPVAFGYLYDQQGNYAAIMQIVAVLFGSGSLMLLTLGRYPTTEPDDG